MKSCDEIAAELLERREAYKKNQRKKRKKIASGAMCFCLAAVLGFGAWQSGIFANTPKTHDEDELILSEESKPQEILSAGKGKPEDDENYLMKTPDKLSKRQFIKPEDFVVSDATKQPDSIGSEVDMGKYYMSAAELLTDENTAIVIEGEVLSSQFVNLSSETRNPGMLVPTTKSIVKINSVFKGGAQPGDEICVVECGGFVPSRLAYDLVMKTKFPDLPEYSGSEDAVDEYRTMGYKPCEKGERVILILYEHKWEDSPENNAFYVGEGESVYAPANTVQGKYLAQNGKAVNYHGKAMRSEDVYMMYTNEDFEFFPDKMFTLSDFKAFAEKTFNEVD